MMTAIYATVDTKYILNYVTCKAEVIKLQRWKQCDL